LALEVAHRAIRDRLYYIISNAPRRIKLQQDLAITPELYITVSIFLALFAILNSTRIGVYQFCGPRRPIMHSLKYQCNLANCWVIDNLANSSRSF